MRKSSILSTTEYLYLSNIKISVNNIKTLSNEQEKKMTIGQSEQEIDDLIKIEYPLLLKNIS